ncbi:MAG: isoprenylcysteine carboxylmethyltransferase family protein [Thermoguttaceae bacterium]|jgi:protein-S-isoprenylcysteine O-methyltransferase Ste14
MKSPLDRGGLRFFLVLVTLLAGASTHATILAGVPCILLGAALHFWAKGCLRQDRFVAMTGPYRFVRHPFYLANALIDGGIAVMSGAWPIRLALPAWWLAVYLPVMRKEERRLTAAFGSTYADYRRRVPGLIPWRRPLPRGGPGFQWSNPNIADGEEIPRAVRILAYPLLLLVWTDLRTDRWAVLADGLKLLALSTLIMLYALSWALRRHQRRRRPILPRAAGHPALRAAAALGILTIAALAPAPATLIDDWLLPACAALVTLSAAIYFEGGRPKAEGGRRRAEGGGPAGHRSTARVAAAECAALLAALAACRALWLAPPAIFLYAAWALDARLPGGGGPSAGPTGQPPPRIACPPLYYLLAAAAIVACALRLLGLPASP